jgi:F-type H+-transporting ATPase subunit b
MSLVRSGDGGFVLAQADHASPAATAADPHAADTHAGTGAAGGHGDGHGAFPPFAPEHFAAQLLWLAITFGALYFILSRVALPRIAEILEVRQGRIAADLAEAQRLKDESEAAIAAYEKALAEARRRAQAIAGETRDAVARETAERRKTLEAELAEKLAAAEAQIASTKTAALGNVRGIAVDAAHAIVERLTGSPATPAEVEQAVDSTLSARS